MLCFGNLFVLYYIYVLFKFIYFIFKLYNNKYFVESFFLYLRMHLIFTSIIKSAYDMSDFV